MDVSDSNFEKFGRLEGVQKLPGLGVHRALPGLGQNLRRAFGATAWRRGCVRDGLRQHGKADGVTGAILRVLSRLATAPVLQYQTPAICRSGIGGWCADRLQVWPCGGLQRQD